MHFRVLALVAGVVLCGCVASGSGDVRPAERMESDGQALRPSGAWFTLGQFDNYVEQVSGLDVAARQNEARRLQSSLAMTPGERLELAYLLSLEGASADDLGQAQLQLDGLDAAFENPATRLYVRLLQRTVAAQEAYKQERKRADDLQQKLKQIKQLELELLKRSQAQPVPAK